MGSLETTGGDRSLTKKAFIGSTGMYFALQKSREEWVSKIWKNSTKLYSVNKVGGSCKMTKPLRTKSLKLNIYLIPIS